MPQVGLKVLPTRSIYDFDDGHVHVTLTFMTPALPDDLDVLARPLTYLTWEVRSADGAAHEVSLYDSTSSLLAVNTPDQEVEWSRETIGDLTALRVGTADQTLLQPAGDDTRIDWGYAYAAAPAAQAEGGRSAPSRRCSRASSSGDAPRPGRRPDAPRRRRRRARAGVRLRPRRVGDEPGLAAPDDRLRRDLRDQVPRPEAPPLLAAGRRDARRSAPGGRAGLRRPRQALRGVRQGADGRPDARQGGERYAQIAALAYRQALAGCGLAADANKQPLLFPKENTSNGCIATVDVIYPAAPQFLLMGPTYAKALVAPAMVYSASPRWKFPFAPHDVGIYPQANGQVYGGGESLEATRPTRCPSRRAPT